LLGKLDFITNFISNHNLKANIVDPDHFLMLMASANDLENILKI